MIAKLVFEETVDAVAAPPCLLAIVTLGQSRTHPAAVAARPPLIVRRVA